VLIVFIDRVEHLDIDLWGNYTEFPGDLRLLLEKRTPFFLKKSKFKILCIADEMVKNCNAVESILAIVELNVMTLLFRMIFGDEKLIEISMEFGKYFVDDVIVYLRRNIGVFKAEIMSF
jgi:hypothetical protein